MIEDQVQSIRERMQKILESRGNSNSAMPQSLPDAEAANIKEDDSESMNKSQAPVNLCSTLDETALRELLSWAAQVSEQEMVLAKPVHYVEAALRTVTTIRVSWYAAHYLATISHARFERQYGSFGSWTPQWWGEREQEAIVALGNLRQVLENKGGIG